MSGELHEISQAIGALQAASAAATANGAAIWNELKELNAKLTPLLQLADDVAEMKPAVEDWKRTKQRGIGIVTVAGLGGAALGSGFSSLLKKWGWL